MAYTHTFEINTETMTIEGELDFDIPGDGVKITNGQDIELTNDELSEFKLSLNRIFSLCEACGEITTFEVAKK